MNGPRIGERYEKCPHAKDGQRHWWRDRGRWLALCPACNKQFAARKPIALVGTTFVREEDSPLTTQQPSPRPSVGTIDRALRRR